MTKILTIAWREFLTTVTTKGFVFGLLIPPVLIGVAIALIPMLINKKPPSVSGHIAIVDVTGEVAPRLERAFSEEAVRERRGEMVKEAQTKGIEVASERLGLDEEQAKKATEAAQQATTSGMGALATQSALASLPRLSVRVLPKETDVEEAKQEIMLATGREQASDGGDKRLALLVVPEGALTMPQGAQAFDRYDLFVAPRLDPEVQSDIRSQAAAAIVDARLQRAGFDADSIRSLTATPRATTKTVTKEGERKTSEAAAFILPAAFMFLMWIAVMTGGQYLLAGTIEEKGNRVMEVLLSAASPTQLMLGKILGKGAVGVLVLALYGGAGVLALIAFAMTHLIAWQSLALVIVYFLIAYMTIACLFAAIGAAVTEVTEAQSLMAPVMMLMVIPMMLWLPIVRNPNSTFATVCSFVPGINPFVMVLRISGSEPIPSWQVPVSLLIGLVTVAFMVWACAKIFRVGVLMYGKAPNLRTLARWVRMA